MLQNDLEIVVQYPSGEARVCRGFTGFKLARSVLLRIDGEDGTQRALAAQLGDAVCNALGHLQGVVELKHRMPCSGRYGIDGCHALDTPSCRKLLVFLPANTTPSTAIDTTQGSAEVWWSHQSEPEWSVLPLLKKGMNAAAVLPAPWDAINAAVWHSSALEIVPAIMTSLGINPEANRIFISYVRRETSDLADQLFAALTQDGFDVFLDRCSLAAGFPFQQRMLQDLCDKSMMLLLNSPSVDQSHWVASEIALARTYRLGLFELQLPSAMPRADIKADQRTSIRRSDLTSFADTPYSAGALKDAALVNIVRAIRDTHYRAVHRRRFELMDNLVAALLPTGKMMSIASDGTFRVAGRAGVDHVIGLKVRPPELVDFSALHTAAQASVRWNGWLISPTPFLDPSRKSQIDWLSGLSNIRHADEAQIGSLIAQL